INVLSPKTNFYHDVEHLFSFKNYSLCNNKKKDEVCLLSNLCIERKYLNKIQKEDSTIQFEISLKFSENYTSVYLSVPFEYVQENNTSLLSLIPENPIEFFSYFRSMNEKYQANSYFDKNNFFNNLADLLNSSEALDFDNVKFPLKVLKDKKTTKRLLNKTISTFSLKPSSSLESLYMNLKEVYNEIFNTTDERFMLGLFQDICNLFIYIKGEGYEQKEFYDFIIDQEYEISET
ncbi:hypothetical protein NGRA_3553, partial [Nosema granulosis]